MAFTLEALDTPIPSARAPEVAIPDKEFIGYDPKGTTTITGSPRTPATPDAQQVNTTEDPEESITLSPKITALARKEQAMRQREATLKQREKALADKLADADRFAGIREKIAAKDYSAADELGMSHEEYTQHLLKKQSESDPQEQRYKELQDKIAAMEKQQEEIAVREYEANQTLWKAEISKIVGTGDDYSTIRELGAEEIVLQHINDSFEEDGVELSAEEAAKEIEAALYARAEKFASVSKIKKNVEPAKLGPPKPKTITQQMTVTSQKPVTKPFHLMSESEQIAEAYRRVQAAKQQR